MTFNSILYQVDGGVAQIILNKPDRLNALDKQALIEINEAMNSAEENHEVRSLLLVVTGAHSLPGLISRRRWMGAHREKKYGVKF